jgi:hypothetical protein
MRGNTGRMLKWELPRRRKPRIHNLDRVYHVACEYCDFFFSERSSLQRHRIKIHGAEKLPPPPRPRGYKHKRRTKRRAPPISHLSPLSLYPLSPPLPSFADAFLIALIEESFEECDWPVAASPDDDSTDLIADWLHALASECSESECL